MTTTADEIIPADYRHLLENANYGHLGTIRPDDTVQVNPMWFDWDGELLRFGPGEQMAKVERREEARLVDPLPIVDQLAMHDRDLPGGSTEADAADSREHAHQLAKRRIHATSSPANTPAR